MILYGCLYILFIVLTFGISLVIRPCIFAVMNAFNFIDDDNLNKIQLYYNRLLKSLKLLKKVQM